MKTKTIWRMHSWLGLITGIPLLVIAFTGSILVFKDEINRLLMPGKVLVDADASARELPLGERLSMLQEDLPGYEVTGWAFYEPPRRSDFVYVVQRGDHEWLHVYQNPYTGEVLSKPRRIEDGLMGWILMLHYTFLAGHIGMLICGILAVLLCALGLTGLWLYRKFWIRFFTLRWDARLRILAGNLHKRIGIISGPVFLILGITGAWWNIEHVILEWDHLLEGEAHEPPIEERLYASDIPLETMVAEARIAIPGYEVNYISFPWVDGYPITFYGAFERQSTLRSPYHSTVSFDAQTAEMLAHSRIDEASVLAQVKDAFEPLHFGTFGGIVTKVLWCVLGSAPGVLAISGIFIRVKRRRPVPRI